MPVKIPSPFNDHSADDSAGQIGIPTNVGTKANGGVPITKKGTQWINNTEGEKSGLYWNYPGAQDFASSEKIHLIIHQYNAPNRIQIDTLANDGISFWVYTDQNNYRRWNIGGNDTALGLFRRSPTLIIIDPRADSDINDVGTYDVSNVTQFGISTTFLKTVGTNTNWNYVCNSILMGTKKDDPDTPRLYGNVTLKELHQEVYGSDYSTIKHVFTENIGNTYYYMCPFVIGDASLNGNSTNFDDEGVTIVSPQSNNPSDPRFQLTNDAMRVYLDLKAGDTAKFSGTYIWGTAANFYFDSNVGASVILDGATFIGMGDFLLDEDVSGNAIFDLNEWGVVYNGAADISGSEIRGMCVFNKYSAELCKKMKIVSKSGHFGLGFSEYVSGDVTIDGYEFSGDGTDIYWYGTSGTLTIRCVNGSNPQTTDSAGGTIVLKYIAKISIKVVDRGGNPISGASVWIGKKSDKSEIAKGSTNSDGIFEAEYDYTGDVDVVVHVRKASSPPYYKPVDLLGTIKRDGYSATAVMLEDE